MEAKTPTRRSKRGQPIVSTKAPVANAKDIKWTTSTPKHTLPLDPSKHLTTDDAQIWERSQSENMKTRIYDSFQRTKTTTVTKKAKGRKMAMQSTIEETETFRVGDTVLVEGYGREQNVAVIAGMWETDLKDAEEYPLAARMYVLIHWFVKNSQLPRIRAQREISKNEVFFSINQNTVLQGASAIIERCRVFNSALDEEEYDDDDDDDGEDKDSLTAKTHFICRYATDAWRGLFYDFIWSEHRKEALQRLGKDPKTYATDAPWLVAVPDQRPKPKDRRKDKAAKPKAMRRPKADVFTESASEGSGASDREAKDYRPDTDDGDEDDIHDELADSEDEDHGTEDELSDFNDEPRTPSRKRNRKGKSIAHPTPHSKARLAPSSPRKRQKFTRAAQISYAVDTNLENLPTDPYLRAMHVLHVGARPETLPCRTDEFGHVLKCVNDLLEEGSGGCVYISGVPGTGKTATVHAVIRELKKMAEENETNPFEYVEINGLRVPEPPAAYIELWQALSGHNVKRDGRMAISAKESLKALTAHFGKGRGRGPQGHACVVLMDELDQLVTTKQDVVYNFFNWPTLKDSQLIVVAVANTHDLPERVMTGRVRSRLGMTRINFTPYKAPQLAEIVTARLKSANIEPGDKGPIISANAIKLAAAKVANITGDARRVLDVCRRAVELVREEGRVAAQGEINEVMRVMQNSPTAAYLRDLSFHERLMLASLVKCVKREGVEEIKWGEIQYQHLTYLKVLAGADDPKRKPTMNEFNLVLESLASSRALLIEEGARKPDEERKVMLNIEQNEVERVLAEVGGDVWKAVLN